MGQRKNPRKSIKSPVVGIVMGSQSDLPVMKEAFDVLDEFSIAAEITVVSAHRTPDRMVDYARRASRRGIKIIIAGAGGAAHLPGMLASFSTVPVIGVPIQSTNSISGIDSLLSIVQMPPGVPVATVGINSGKNAGILAAQFLSVYDEALACRIVEHKKTLKSSVEASIKKMITQGLPNRFDRK